MDLVRSDAPIGRIIPDVLRLVFWIVAKDEPVDHLHPDVRTSWIRLGRVCAFWRNVLMDMPALWAKNVSMFLTRRGFDEILARARDAPLELRHYRPMTQDTADRVAALVPRACLIEIAMFSSTEERLLLDSVLHRHLPSLHTLILDDSRDISRFQQTSHTQPLVGLNTLSKLELHGPKLPLPLSGRLVGLHIQGPISLYDVLHVMKHNTALENIVLGTLLSEKKVADRRSLLVMPALALLDVHVTSPDVLHALLGTGALQMPALQKLDISVDHPGLASGKVFDALNVVLPTYRAAFVIPISSMLALNVIDTENMLQVDLELDSDEPHRKWLHITILHPGAPPDVEDLFGTAQSFLGAHIAENVQKLSWHSRRGERSQTSEYWRLVHLPFTSAERLRIFAGAQDLQNIPFALAPRTPRGRPPLPALRRVQVWLSSSHADFPRPAVFREAIRRRVEVGGAAFEVWAFVRVRKQSEDAVKELQTLAGNAGVELSDVCCRDGLAEGRLMLDEE